jgi:hypothetical protein
VLFAKRPAHGPSGGAPLIMRTARRRYDVNEAVSLKAQMQLAAEQGMSHGMLDVDFKARAARRAHAASRGWLMRCGDAPCNAASGCCASDSRAWTDVAMCCASFPQAFKAAGHRTRVVCIIGWAHASDVHCEGEVEGAAWPR